VWFVVILLGKDNFGKDAFVLKRSLLRKVTEGGDGGEIVGVAGTGLGGDSTVLLGGIVDVDLLTNFTWLLVFFLNVHKASTKATTNIGASNPTTSSHPKGSDAMPLPIEIEEWGGTCPSNKTSKK
jgi:hypothetical protein